MIDDEETVDRICSPARNTNSMEDINSLTNRKIICRYGRGCTHKSDPSHRERFWHPPVPELNGEQIRTHYICYECAESFANLNDLQQHLTAKTAWSNNSLVNCRISCLIDQKEWHEGLVTQYHKSGKHYVEFRTMFEKRWIQMNKVAFYIIERGNNSPPLLAMNNSTDEYKEGGAVNEYDKNPSNDDFIFQEELTIDYAFAQSVLYKIYGTGVQETGHRTKGHTCLTDEDKDCTKVVKGSLLYGELLPRVVNKALGTRHLNAANCKTLFDMGMGIGKVVLQAFLQFRNLEFVYGVELSVGRFNIAEESVMRMVALFGADAFTIERVPGESITVVEKPVDENDRCRVLKMERGNMFDVSNIEMADIVMLETDVPPEYHPEICKLLSNLRLGARTLTYLDLRLIWPADQDDCQFAMRQVDVNRSITDRFPTSWSVQRGHHFYLWSVVPPNEVDLLSNQQDLLNTSNIVRGLEHLYELNSPTFTSAKSSSAEDKKKSRKKKGRKPILNFFRKIFSLRKSFSSGFDRNLSSSSSSTSGSCFPHFFGGSKATPNGENKSQRDSNEINDLSHQEAVPQNSTHSSQSRGGGGRKLPK